MKIRIDRDLFERAHVCAKAIDVTLSCWSSKALKQFRSGGIPRVVNDKITKNATRRGSVVVSLPGDHSERDEMRNAIQSAVAYCESVREKPFVSKLREGVDYIVVKEME